MQACGSSPHKITRLGQPESAERVGSSNFRVTMLEYR